MFLTQSLSMNIYLKSTLGDVFRATVFLMKSDSSDRNQTAEITDSSTAFERNVLKCQLINANGESPQQLNKI